MDIVFNFHHLKVDYANGQKWTLVPHDLAALKRILDEWATGMQEGNGWNALFWNNHDQPRALDRFGDPQDFHAQSATMLATVIHLMRGTPYVYMGEEIGMTDPEYLLMSDYVDVEAHNAYAELLATGESAERAFQIVHSKARDNARTPMQWDDSPNAGFTDGIPWLRPTNQDRINVAAEQDSGRILGHYRRLIQLRKSEPLISAGRYESFDSGHEAVFGYLRTLQERRLLVLGNFRGEPAGIQIPPEFADGTLLIGNHDDAVVSREMMLRPYEALGIVVEP